MTKEELAIPKYPDFCDGPAYVLGASAVRTLVQNLPPKKRWIPIEDAFIGLVANRTGLKPVPLQFMLFKKFHEILDEWHPGRIVQVYTDEVTGRRRSMITAGWSTMKATRKKRGVLQGKHKSSP